MLPSVVELLEAQCDLSRCRNTGRNYVKYTKVLLNVMIISKLEHCTQYVIWHTSYTSSV